MKEADSDLSDAAVEVIPLHFDLPGHHIPLNDFIVTAKKTEAIIDGFNKQLFGGKLKFELLVMPPQQGGFVEILGHFIPIAYVGTVWAVFQTNEAKAFVEGLTGHEPVHWFKIAGEKVRELLSKRVKNDQGTPSVEEKDRKVIQQTESLIIVQMVIAFLRKDPDSLAKMGISARNFREAFEARNEFYQVCNSNKEIKGLGFDEAHDFPIKRRDFVNMQVKLPPREEKEEEHEWLVGIERIVVPAPVWEQELQKSHKWLGRMGDEKQVHFVIEDQSFWKHRDMGDLNLKPNDNLKVQWIYEIKNGRRVNVRVLRVLEFNGEHLADPFSDDVLGSLISKFRYEDREQGDWVSELDQNSE